MKSEVLIIGGGLIGLALANKLAADECDFLLIEGRDRLGGRILTEAFRAGHFDLGPTWFWPGQPRLDNLLRQHGIEWFEQFSDGVVSFEDEKGQVERGRGFASMAGSFRVNGGFNALVRALECRLPSQSLKLSHPISTLTRTSEGIRATATSGLQVDARRVVLALPPRIACDLIYSPALPEKARQAMAGIATWMAGQAKAVAIYNEPFWRDAGLSGDAMSRHGPLVEVHDASPANGGPYALFGFVGFPPQARMDQTSLRQAIRHQLVRLFGPEAAEQIAFRLKDWAFDAFTSTKMDLDQQHMRHQFGLPSALSGLWDDRLIVSGAETASQFGGLIEGALEAADHAFELLRMERV